MGFRRVLDGFGKDFWWISNMLTLILPWHCEAARLLASRSHKNHYKIHEVKILIRATKKRSTDGWMDGWTDAVGWMDACHWMDRWTDGWSHVEMTL